MEKRLYLDRPREAQELRSLELQGFRPVECPRRKDGTAAVERRLPLDALSFAWQRAHLAWPGTVVLASGDEDFAELLHRLRDLGLLTVVVLPDGRAASALSAAADVAVGEAELSLVPAMPAVAASRGAAAAGPSGGLASQAALLRGLAAGGRPLQSPRSRGAPGAVESMVLGKLKAWPELTPGERRAALALGYTGPAWDGGEPPTSATLAPWAGLSSEEREAAALLGWAAADWDSEIAALAAAMGSGDEGSNISATGRPSPPEHKRPGMDSSAGMAALLTALAGRASEVSAASTAPSDFLDAIEDDLELGLVSAGTGGSLRAESAEGAQVEYFETFEAALRPSDSLELSAGDVVSRSAPVEAGQLTHRGR